MLSRVTQPQQVCPARTTTSLFMTWLPIAVNPALVIKRDKQTPIAKIFSSRRLYEIASVHMVSKRHPGGSTLHIIEH